jgi:glycosyltransferase involved in cell wall biosynthesis
MKLLIVSHTAHYQTPEGIVGWGPTVREINSLSRLFDQIHHIAFLHSGKPPESSLPYSSNRINFIPVKPTGGQGVLKKMGILATAPRYLAAIQKQLSWADIVHVRCVANISLMAILWLGFVKDPRYRWVKYAGNWQPNGDEPLSFTLQRWWLNKGFHRGIVTVNGSWPEQAAHIYSFLNPCITSEELQSARKMADAKTFRPPYRFLFAGNLEDRKGVGRGLKIVSELHHNHAIPVQFDLVGDSPNRLRFENKAIELGLSGIAHFHGWLARSELNRLYAKAHFLLLPSENEGWPKVISESMAYGTVPVASAVASIPQMLETLKSGRAIPVERMEMFVDAILNYVKNPQTWTVESKNASLSAERFTYSNYLNNVRDLLSRSWGLSVPEVDQ